MANEGIKRKDLWMGLNNVDQKDWIKAAEELGLLIVKSNSGTSHYITFRDPKNPNLDDIRGLVTTVTPNCYKQANRSIFKAILKYVTENSGAEDDIWRALRKLK